MRLQACAGAASVGWEKVRTVKTSPLEQVKAKFESKEKLVEEVRQLASGDWWVDKANQAKGLACVSNRKLIALHKTLGEARNAFSSRQDLAAAVAAAEGHGTDKDYRTALESLSAPALWSRYIAAKRRAKRAAAA